MSRYLVTSALPYANGPIHLGHLAGAYLPADIFVRSRRMNGDDVLYICGSDEHGVPITLRAEKEGVTPRAVVDRFHDNMGQSFVKMNVEFDNFSGTARPLHYEVSQQFFKDLLANGHIMTKTEEQFYDEKQKRFLPDRYVEGNCPHCGYDKARGDQCDKCGKLLNPTELINPRSALSGEKPVIRETTHWYFKLQDFEQKLTDWLKNNRNWKDNVRNFVLGWINTEGLRERAITRDIDWGVPVPLEGANGKVLYVWFDAPIGYISSTIEWAENKGKPEAWKDYWLNKDTKLVHFIGKDNIPFHAIIWPAMLMGQNTPYVLPADVPANEYLTLEGEKISTSQNWAVWVDEYLERFPADPLRYFLASNAPESKDADFSWKSFQARNNDELANIYGNFANRTLAFLNNNCGGVIPEAHYQPEDEAVFKSLANSLKEMNTMYETYRVREACRMMMDIARLGNRYFDEMKPWVLKKENPARMNTVLNVCLNILRALAVASYPVIPSSAEKLWKMIAESGSVADQRWETAAAGRVKPGQKLGEVAILFVKYEDKEIEAELKKLHDKSAAAKAAATPSKGEKKMETSANTAPAAAVAAPAEKTTVTIDDFKKFDLRVAEILEAVPLEKSNKLFKLQVQVGDVKKQILAGIKQFYSAEQLVGRKVIIINNLEPAKLMGETSEGMVLAASNSDKSQVIFLTPEKDIESGAKVS